MISDEFAMCVFNLVHTIKARFFNACVARVFQKQGAWKTHSYDVTIENVCS